MLGGRCSTRWSPTSARSCWIVDLNRQSPRPGGAQHRRRPAARACSTPPAGRCITVKFGRLLEELFARPGGDALRAPHRRHDQPGVPAAAALHRRRAARTACPATARARRSPRCSPDLDDATLPAAIRNLGGHDLDALRDAFDAIDDTRPTVIIAYTVKGYGLPTEGHPQNHSSLLTVEQIRRARRRGWARTRRPVGAGSPPARPPRRCAAAPPTGCAATPSRPRAAPALPDRPRPHARRAPPPPRPRSAAPCSTSPAPRPRPPQRVVTVSPDVSSQHQPRRLGQQGRRVVDRASARDWFADDAETILHWRERPTGQHIELGHRRDQPRRPARRARRHLEPLGRAAASRSG